MATRTTPHAMAGSKGSFLDTYTRDITREEVHRLFKRDTREAYQYFSKDIRADAADDGKQWYERAHRLNDLRRASRSTKQASSACCRSAPTRRPPT